jgi:hypothetical protein
LRDLERFIAVLRTELTGASYTSTGAATDSISEAELLNIIGAMFRSEEESVETEA